MSAVTNSTWTTLSFVNEAASSSSTTTSFVTLKWKCFKMVCSHVEEEPVLQEITGVVIPTKPWMWDWIYTPAGSGRGTNLHYMGLLPNSLYRAAHFADVEGILGFSVPSIILANLLENTRLFVRVQKVRFCDLWLVALDPSGFFCVSRFVACDSPGSGNNRLVCFEDFSDLSYSCHLQE